MAEFNSAPYFPIDLKGLTALQALAPDPDIRARAARGIARLLEIVANSAHQGILTAAQGRSYEHSLRAALASSSPPSPASSGAAARSAPASTPSPSSPSASATTASPSPTSPPAPSGNPTPSRNGPSARARTPSPPSPTPRPAPGPSAPPPATAGANGATRKPSSTPASAPNPQAQIWINHPGELLQSGSARPSYWGGSASIPRVQQYRALALVAFDGTAPQPDLTHAWFPRPAFDESHVHAHTAFARTGDGLAALIADGPLEEITTGPSAHCELRRAGRHARWLLRLGAGRLRPPSAPASPPSRSPSTPTAASIVDDPDYGVVEFNPDGTVTAEGRTLDPARWTLEGTRTERRGFQGRTP